MQDFARQRRRAALHRARPADYRADLPGQAEFMGATERRVVWFGFNGGGKTEALVRRCIQVFEGTDVICAGVTRSLVMLLCVTGYDAVSCRDFARQLHEMAPAGLLAQVDIDERGNPIGRASEWYGPAKGFRGRPPRLVVQRGPMRGTTLNITTMGSGQGAAAGGTVDLVLVNEPINEAMLEELASRDRNWALGYLWYVLTPIPGAPSQRYLERGDDNGPGLCERWGATCRFIRTELTRDALVLPSGRRLEPWAKTEARISGWSPSTRPMRMGISLEPLLEAGYFAEVWDPARHVLKALPSGLSLWLVGSIDHSFRSGRVAVGVTAYSVSGAIGSRRLVGYDHLDLLGDGIDYDVVADQFLQALESVGIPLEAIDEWVGDRASVSHLTHRRRDNLTWRGAILAALRRRAVAAGMEPSTIRAPLALWRIATPRKRPGSSEYLMAQLRAAMAEKVPRLYFLQRCQAVTSAIQGWDGTEKSADKDPLDRLGYSWERAHRHFGLWRD